jgi:hypothetical protein
MDMGYGIVKMIDKNIQDFIEWIKKMGSECINGLINNIMKAALNKILDRGMEDYI